LPPALRQLQQLLTHALAVTAALWPPLEQAYAWVHGAAHLLTNAEGCTGEQVRLRYQQLLDEMETQRAALGTLSGAVDQFRKVTLSFAPGLFHCYRVADLPRTNNDLERCFGAVRYHERRTTGRRGAIPGVVVRGAVRVLTALVSRLQPLATDDLPPTDYAAWRRLRQQLAYREEARRQQWRFRKDTHSYLAAIEARLLQ
jgi:hypothetical protein